MNLRGRPRWQYIVAGVIGVFVVFAVIGAIVGPQHHSTAQGSPSSAPTCDLACTESQMSSGVPSDVPVATDFPTDVPTDALTDVPSLPSAPPSVPSLASKVSDWYQGVKDDFDAISGDQGDIGTAASTGDESALAAPCASLKDDVVTFEADPAAPDSQLRSDLARAMDYYSTAASECLNGDLTSSASDLTSGTSWISKATARISELGTGN